MEGAEAAVPGDASLHVPVACINLLRCNMQARKQAEHMGALMGGACSYSGMLVSVMQERGVCKYK